MRRTKTRLVLFALFVTTTSRSVCATEEVVGAELGLRVGYAIPFGKIKDDDSEDMSDNIAGAVPFWFDLGYRFSPRLMLGGYFQHGLGIFGSGVSERCNQAAADCSSTVMKLGVQVQAHLGPGEKVDPWLGAGVGYEWLGLDTLAGDIGGPYGARGFELLGLQGGVDLAVTRGLAVGPFLALSLGQYGTETCPVCSISTTRLTEEGPTTIDRKAFHQWLTFGARGRFVATPARAKRAPVMRATSSEGEGFLARTVQRR